MADLSENDGDAGSEDSHPRGRWGRGQNIPPAETAWPNDTHDVTEKRSPCGGNFDACRDYRAQPGPNGGDTRPAMSPAAL
jgi:hypothetical protein